MGLRTEPDEFDLLKKKARQQATAASQQAQEGLKRRFARLGNLQSGAFIKQAQLAEQESQKRAQEAESSIDIARLQQQRAEQEQEKQRQFASQEALKQREFAAGEGAKQRELASSQFAQDMAFRETQAKLGRQFTAEENNLARQFSARAQQIGIKAAADEAALNRSLTREQQEFTQQMARAEFKQNVLTNMINTIISAKNSNMDPNALLNKMNTLGVDVDFDSGEVIIGGIDEINRQRQEEIQRGLAESREMSKGAPAQGGMF